MNNMKRMLFALFCMGVLFCAIIPTAHAATVSGNISGPSSVKIGKTFTVKIMVKNTGSTTASCGSVALYTPYGFSASQTNFGFNVLKPGASQSFTTTAGAPASLQISNNVFSGSVSYGDGASCGGTTSTSSLVPYSVQLKK